MRVGQLAGIVCACVFNFNSNAFIDIFYLIHLILMKVTITRVDNAMRTR